MWINWFSACSAHSTLAHRDFKTIIEYNIYYTDVARGMAITNYNNDNKVVVNKMPLV